METIMMLDDETDINKVYISGRLGDTSVTSIIMSSIADSGNWMLIMTISSKKKTLLGMKDMHYPTKLLTEYFPKFQGNSLADL